MNNDMSLVAQAGGHSVLGHSTTDGGMILDLSRLKGLDIDADGRTGWAGGGLLAGEYTKATAEHGLVTGFGDTPTVGITGITLGGGVGFLHRKLGLTLDSVLGAEVVTADGQVRLIDEERTTPTSSGRFVVVVATSVSSPSCALRCIPSTPSWEA